MKEMTYSADLLLSGELKGELGRDGLPTYFRGRYLLRSRNHHGHRDADYPMAIDSTEVSLEWDSGRRVLGGALQDRVRPEQDHAVGAS